MSPYKYSLLIVILEMVLVCHVVFSQSVENQPYVKITVSKGEHKVSGIYPDQLTQDEARQIITKVFGSDVKFESETIKSSLPQFQGDWKKEFENELSKLKTWKSGIFVFKQDTSNITRAAFQRMANIEIQLIGQSGKKFKLSDYDETDKVLVVYLMATWCSPCILQYPDLQKMYSEDKTGRLEIIGVDADESDFEYLPRFVKNMKATFPHGISDESFANAAFEVSRMNAIPQAFVIHRGELKSVFVGAGNQARGRLRQAVADTLKK